MPRAKGNTGGAGDPVMSAKEWHKASKAERKAEKTRAKEERRAIKAQKRASKRAPSRGNPSPDAIDAFNVEEDNFTARWKDADDLEDLYGGVVLDSGKAAGAATAKATAADDCPDGAEAPAATAAHPAMTAATRESGDMRRGITIVDDPSLPLTVRLDMSRRKLDRIREGGGLGVLEQWFGPAVPSGRAGPSGPVGLDAGPTVGFGAVPSALEGGGPPTLTAAVMEQHNGAPPEHWSQRTVGLRPRSQQPHGGDACSLLDDDGDSDGGNEADVEIAAVVEAVGEAEGDVCSLLDGDDEANSSDDGPLLSSLFQAAASYDGTSVELAEAAMLMQQHFEQIRGVKFGEEARGAAFRVVSRFCAGRPIEAKRVLLTEFLRLVADFEAEAVGRERGGGDDDTTATATVSPAPLPELPQSPIYEEIDEDPPHTAPGKVYGGVLRVSLPYSDVGYGFTLRNDGCGFTFATVHPDKAAQTAGLRAGMRILKCNDVDVSEDPGFNRLDTMFQTAAMTGSVVLEVAPPSQRK